MKAKHDHTFRVIAHSIDWQAALLDCADCHKTEAWSHTNAAVRVKISPRRYRPATTREFVTVLAEMEHLCCV